MVVWAPNEWGNVTRAACEWYMLSRVEGSSHCRILYFLLPRSYFLAAIYFHLYAVRCTLYSIDKPVAPTPVHRCNVQVLVEAQWRSICSFVFVQASIFYLLRFTIGHCKLLPAAPRPLAVRNSLVHIRMPKHNDEAYLWSYLASGFCSICTVCNSKQS